MNLLQLYQNDISFFSMHALGHYTWSKQREIYESVQNNEKTIVTASHGVSKTFSMATVAVWNYNCFRGSLTVTTAPTFPQVKGLLWKEIRNNYVYSRVKLSGECLDVEVKNPKYPKWKMFGFSTDRADRAEGQHESNIMWLYDEAKGIPHWMWDSTMGSMTGGKCRWLVVSTTDGVRIGEDYYNAVKRSELGWNHIHISAYDSPLVTGEKMLGIHIPNYEKPDEFEWIEKEPEKLNIQIASPKWIDDCEKKWGGDSALFMTKVKGELVDQAAGSIIRISSVYSMFDNWENPEYQIIGPYISSCDPALGGTDDAVFFKGRGMWCDYPMVISPTEFPKEKIGTFLADRWEQFLGFSPLDYNTFWMKDEYTLIVDRGGGEAVINEMQNRGWNVISMWYQQNAIKKDQYVNATSEMWIDDADTIYQCACPRLPRLEAELTGRIYGNQDGNGRRKVESKDDFKGRGFDSPDMADSFLQMRYALKLMHTGFIIGPEFY